MLRHEQTSSPLDFFAPVENKEHIRMNAAHGQRRMEYVWYRAAITHAQLWEEVVRISPLFVKPTCLPDPKRNQRGKLRIAVMCRRKS